MLMGLILRAVAFEFRYKATRSWLLWDIGFAGGSIVASFIQGTAVEDALRKAGLPVTVGRRHERCTPCASAVLRQADGRTVAYISPSPVRSPFQAPYMSVGGTFETCRRSLRMSVDRGGPEVTGPKLKTALLTHLRHRA
jgi:hypothetical protein